MKIKLILANLAIITFVAGLLLTVGIGIKTGAIVVLAASSLFLVAYIIQIVHSIRQRSLWHIDNLLYSLTLFVMAVIFIHGFSLSIDMPFLGNIPVFRHIFLVTGLLVTLLFLVVSRQSAVKLDTRKTKLLLNSIISIVTLVSVLGLLGISGILPFSGRLITYSLVFLNLFYAAFFAIKAFSDKRDNKTESLLLSFLSVAILFFMLVRFYFPHILPQGLAHSIVSFGFLPVALLPLSIYYIKRWHFFTAFLLYFICLDLYFLHTDRNFNYLVNVGINGCVGYENATAHKINMDPGIPIEDLLKEPQEEELNAIVNEWREKDFAPSHIRVEYAKRQSNGDSIKVISHLVNGKKHYGMVRIPHGINADKAPILLGLMGGGTGLDVLKTNDMYRLSSGNCRTLLDQYMTIMPSFRGNIVRGEDFCFRSEGYMGDVWLGAAEDAVYFLETVKVIYNKAEDTRILGKGGSRGATVALIIGGLTDKLDYIIATSTHTNFTDPYVVKNEQVGRSYSRAFYTPKAPTEEIRKRIIASSPYYFTNYLPEFEIHQGSEDHKTTIRHTKTLEDRLKKTGRNENTYHIYMYQGKGHGYDDDNRVCKSLQEFLDI